MNKTEPLRWAKEDPASKNILLKSAIAAGILELCLLTGIGWHEHWLAHPQKTTGLDETKFVEAEVFQYPEKAHLTEEKPQTPAQKEATISTRPGQGKSHPAPSLPLEEENQTESGSKFSSDHGPVAVYAPSPIIPAYLRDQSLNAFVLIDFFVTAQGGVIPRLVGSSGNEELDALALETVKKWQFRPAEKDHKPIDAKVRLRIIFQVD